MNAGLRSHNPDMAVVSRHLCAQRQQLHCSPQIALLKVKQVCVRGDHGHHTLSLDGEVEKTLPDSCDVQRQLVLTVHLKALGQELNQYYLVPHGRHST